MKLYTLKYTQRLPIDREDAWKFFSNPEKLQDITPDDMAFQILDAPSRPMYPGLIIRYLIQPFTGFKVQWVAEITQVREGEYFVDEQRFGPFRFWHHEHRFVDVDGGVEMRDTVHYVMPLSILGRFVHRLLIRKRLEEIFLFRKKQLATYFSKIDE